MYEMDSYIWELTVEIMLLNILNRYTFNYNNKIVNHLIEVCKNTYIPICS